MAIACEAGELIELFQWLSESESNAIMRDILKATDVRHEIADILIYLIRLADVLEIDLGEAARVSAIWGAGVLPSSLRAPITLALRPSLFSSPQTKCHFL